ncbi:MAG: hypothetical protein J5707_02115 [Candidatus Methanomethylophilus sp.]|nr:hypothetical protein [Methanomethylophilus sp.]
MYAVVSCPDCNRYRVIDVSTKNSTCPYCGRKADNKLLKFYYKSDDLEAVRAAQNQLTGFTGSIEKKHASPDTDPYSTLEYRYEHCHSLEEKMDVLAKGLTEVYGEFTFENLEKIEPKHAEKMLKAMLVNGYVHETKYGRYTA